MNCWTFLSNFFSSSFRITRLFLTCGLFLAKSFVFAQTAAETKLKKEQLQLQMKKLQKDIADMERAIQSTSNQKKLTQKQVDALKEKIKDKEGEILGFKKEVNALGRDIRKTEVEIDVKAERVALMKEKYGFILREIYKNEVEKSNANVLLSNADNAFIESSYLKKISEYRRSQAHQLKTNILALEDKKSDLVESKNETVAQLKEQANLKEEMETEQKEKDKEIESLDEKEKKIKKFVEQKNKAAQKLNQSIQRIIEEEIKLAKQKAITQAKQAQAKGNTTTAPKPVNSNKPETYLTPQEMALSKDFAFNQGKLPWPVVKGVVVGVFGKHEHPTIKNVFIENNGIDLKTNPGSNAKAIFEGTVVTIFNLPTTQNCIIIKHGEFFSVYSNIAIPIVKVGDKIATKQSLGSIYTDPADKATKLHLEIWKGKDKINPATWLTSGN